MISILLCSVQAIAAADISDANDDIFDLSNDIETVEVDSVNEAPIVSEEAVAEDSEVLAAPSEESVPEESEVLAAPSSEEVLAAEPDGNFSALQAKINSAPGNNPTITLDRNYVYNSSSSSDRQLITGIKITRSITIDGNGSTIDGKSLARLFNITGSSSQGITVTLKNLNFVNGMAQSSGGNSYGGAIYAYMGSNNHPRPIRLTIDNCTFKNNTATMGSDARRGGAIYYNFRPNNRDYSRADLIIKNSSFENNSAYSGGAIYATKLSIIDSNFTGNKAVNGSAIYTSNSDYGSTKSISNTRILENQANSNNLTLERIDYTTSGYPPQTYFHKFEANFTGNDNLINGIYSSSGTISMTKVTYWGADGEMSTSSTPNNNFREAGILINLVITPRGGGDAILNLTARTNSSGQVVFTNTTIIDVSHLEPGQYDAYVIHYADEYYTEKKSETIQFTCSRGYYNTVIDNQTVEGYAGDEVNVTFTVKTKTGGAAVHNGTVYVIIGDQKYSATVNRTTGKATLTIKLPDADGNYTVFYNGTGTNYYWDSNSTLKITILPKVDTAVAVTPSGDISVGDTETIKFNVTAGSTAITAGTVNITIYDADGGVVDSKTDVPIANGVAGVEFTGLANGTYTVNVTYGGTNKYNPSEGSASFTVSKVDTTTKVTPTNIIVDDNEIIKFTVLDNESAPITGITVNITIIDSEGTAIKTLEDVPISLGVDGINIAGLAVGTYTVNVTFAGTDKYNPSNASATFTVSKHTVTIEVVSAVVGYSGESVPVTIKLTDENGNEVEGGTVEYIIDFSNPIGSALGASNGFIVLGAYVSGGQATENVNLTGAPGKYSATVSYTGNDKYEDATTSDEAEILAFDTTIESEGVSGTAGEKVTVTATIKDNKGNVVQNGTATLIIDGKEYNAAVENGKATWDVELPSENTTATIKYLGNDYYNPSNTTVELTVTEEPQPEPQPGPEPSPEPQPEPQPTASKTVAAEALATGNPIAMLVLVLLTLVSTISIRRQK